jgi:hypothetical protein
MAIKRKIKAKAKAPAIRKPSTAPLDAVRNPNFDAAMAQRNYDNFIAEQRARMGAERGQSGNQDFIDSRDPNKMYTQDMVDYIDPATGEKTSRTRGVVPAPGSRFVPANQAGGLAYNQMPPQGPQAGGGQGDYQFVDPQSPQGQAMQGYQQSLRDALSRYNPNAPSLMPIQTPGSNALNQDLANRGMGGGIPAPMPQGFPDDMQKFRNAALAGMGERMPTPIPQAPQGAQAAMADYSKMLQQGMQRNQDINQAAQNFAGMGGPQRSFSQVAGGVRRMNRTPRQPRPNVIPLPKTRTI